MSTYEGQYEPKDSRDVTLSNERAPGEPDRTGHREGETRQQEQQAEKPDRDPKDGEAQVAYGNSKDREGQMEQDIATDGAKNGTKGGDTAVGETSADPAARARADGNRPISGD